MRLEDVAAPGDGRVSLVLRPESPDDRNALQSLAFVIRNTPAKVEFDSLLNEVRVRIGPNVVRE